jgi:hypothetical protein
MNDIPEDELENVKPISNRAQVPSEFKNEHVLQQLA